MATKTYHQLDADAAGTAHLNLQDGGSAPADATTGTGWIVAKVAASAWSRMESQVERAAATFGAGAVPDSDPPINSLGDCFRTPVTLRGEFAAGDWVFGFTVVSVTATSAQAGRPNIRLWKSSDPTGGTNAFMLSSLRPVTNIATVTTTPSTVTVTVNLPIVSLRDEYIFVQVAWEITTASGSNSGDVLLRVGAGANFTTPDFTPLPANVGGFVVGLGSLWPGELITKI